jgi:prepilin-type N-terminal cleavage/methylation domain-containing protein
MMSRHKGFTLIEVMVSMVLLAIAVIFSLSIVKTVVQKQIDAKSMLRYVWVTKSIKAAFNEYISGSDPSSFAAVETLGCIDKGATSAGKDRFTTQLCDYQSMVNAANTPGSASKSLFVTIATNNTNNVYYFTNRVKLVETANNANVVFDRLFVSQK